MCFNPHKVVDGGRQLWIALSQVADSNVAFADPDFEMSIPLEEQIEIMSFRLLRPELQVVRMNPQLTAVSLPKSLRHHACKMYRTQKVVYILTDHRANQSLKAQP